MTDYNRAYMNGWRTSERCADGALDRADLRGVPDAWYDGYHDYAAGRPRWTWREARRKGCDPNVCDPDCVGHLTDPPTVRPAAWIIAAQQNETCRWFALCENEATGTLPHPILGDVPVCDRCRAKNERLSQ